jgi:DNA-binding GntR family transcriptional regulator
VSARTKAISIVDAVASDLRRRLFAGELAGTQAFTEGLVAEEYETSRPTAKGAIEQLVAEGLFVRGAHKTARVPTLSQADVRDIYLARSRLEGQALRELAERRDVPHAAIEANLRLRRAFSENHLDIVEPDLAFHSAIIDKLESPRMTRLYGTLVSDVRLCMAQVQGRRLLSAEDIANEHDHILRFIAEGDPGAAVAELTAHLSRASERLADSVGDGERTRA